MSSIILSLQSIITAMLPPTCGLCHSVQAEKNHFGICNKCLEHVLINDKSRCRICDLPTTARLCEQCRVNLPPYKAVVAPFLYGGTIAEIITRAKFHKREELILGLARMVVAQERVRHCFKDVSMIVPVPLGTRRLRQRQFNQSAVLARVIGKEMGIRVKYVLKRKRQTLPQSQLSLVNRAQNVKNAFFSRQLVYGRCILVDDVVTSGQTIREAAEVLCNAGASEVIVVAAARTVQIFSSNDADKN
ncbi:MAG: ComF family protein [Deltaproteobacteria bacterium]|nr:ComF family protein [Deltaproteobacteria bacterium]